MHGMWALAGAITGAPRHERTQAAGENDSYQRLARPIF